MPVISRKPKATVLIGCHVSPKLRRDLFLVQANPKNAGRNLKQLLCEAIGDLCAKYEKAVAFEPKMCEDCGRTFLRAIGTLAKYCSTCAPRNTV